MEIETRQDIHCPECGYDLRGTPSDRCPECGTAFDRAALARSTLPWAHRRQIGGVRAYWRTVWLVTFRTGTLRHEVSRAISYRDARRFQLATVLMLAAIAIPLTLLVCYFNIRSTFTRGAGGWDYVLLAALCVGDVLGLFGITGVCSYLFHLPGAPVERQNRAIALSYYACAPLAWVLPATLWMAGVVALEAYAGPAFYQRRMVVFLPVAGITFVLGYGPLISWWISSVRLVQFATSGGWIRTGFSMIALPILWGTVALLAVVAPLLLTALIEMILLSFR